MKETLPNVAKITDPVPKDGIRYRTLFICPKLDFGGQPHLIKGRAVMSGYCVTDGVCNVMPGACWFETVEEAKHGIDVLIAVKGDSDMFWEIMQPYQDTPGERAEPACPGPAAPRNRRVPHRGASVRRDCPGPGRTLLPDVQERSRIALGRHLDDHPG